jgi:hypothetical protein
MKLLLALAVVGSVLFLLSKKWGAKNVLGYALTGTFLALFCFIMAALVLMVFPFSGSVLPLAGLFFLLGLSWVIWQERARRR